MRLVPQGRETDSVATALAALAAGRSVVVAGRRTAEGEGHLVVPADAVSAETVTFMARVAGGLVCVSLGPRGGGGGGGGGQGGAVGWVRVGVRGIVGGRQRVLGASVGISVEAREGVTTGISAADRARTIPVLADPAAGPADLVRPGHIFPLRAEPGGVLARAGRTEAAVDLCRLAGRAPVAAICEILDDDGAVAGYPALTAFCGRHAVPLVEVAELVAHRWRNETLILLEREVDLDTRHGRFRLHGYRDAISGRLHAALVRGEIAGAAGVAVHIRRESLARDLFGGGEPLEAVIATLAAAEASLLIYVTAPDHGLFEDTSSLLAEPLRLGGTPSAPPLYVAAQILRELSPASVSLTPNHGEAAAALCALGISADASGPPEVAPSP